MFLHIFSSFNSISWTGSLSTELFIYPAESSYASQNFLFRISTATVQIETSTFTIFKAYQRLLMVLEGQILLQHDHNDAFALKPLEPHLFSGNSHTISKGFCTDFNIIFKPELSVNLNAYVLNRESHSFTLLANRQYFLYVFSGNADLIAPKKSHLISAKSLVHIKTEETNTTVMLSAKEDNSILILVEISI